MPKPLRETALISERAAVEAKSTGRMLIQFISPGWGSSGYYSPQVLEQAATDNVIPAGTHMYADHPTDAEDQERPVRSIKDLMAVTTEDARFGEGGALVGEVRVVPRWRELVETVRDQIGVSIRGSATDLVEGEAEGRRGRIVEGLVAPVMSVDFVTRAGRGGKVLQVLESAAANRRAIRHGISEATVNDTREALQQLLRDTYGGENTYVWVRDFDDTTVWFEVEDGDSSGIYGQGYTETDGAVSLSGERAEVRIVTTYVPATRPDTTTQESKEDTMPQIEEARLRKLEADAGRVSVLESERDTFKAERDAARREVAEGQARTDALTKARARVTAANANLTVAVVDRIVAEATRTVPLTDAGHLDEAALDTAVDAARTAEETYLSTLAGSGAVTGLGVTAGLEESDAITWDDIDKLAEVN